MHEASILAPRDTSRGMKHGFRSHRLDADGLCPGVADDAGARLLLRGPRPRQKRHQHAHVQLHIHGRSEHRLGALGLQPGLRGGKRYHRRPEPVRPVGHRDRPGRRQRHPHAAVRHLPDDVRHHHAGPHHRRVRRALQVHHLPGLPRGVGHRRVRPRSTLGVGPRGLALQGRRARLRWRHRRPHQRRYGRGGGCAARRKEARPRGRASQRALRGTRGRAALVRVVRLQCRLRAGGQWAGRKRIPGHQYLRRCGRPDLGHHIAGPDGAA